MWRTTGARSTSKTGLDTAATYWFKIKAEGTSDALDSPYGAVIAGTTTPASLTATAVSGSQINLSWVGNAGNSRINGYTYGVATNSSFTGATYTYVAGAGATSASHTGLSPGTTYYYKIKVEGTSDSYDSAYTQYSAATTTSGSVPNAPSGLSASVVSDSQVNLSWTDNSTNETGFEVKRATDSAFSKNVAWIGGIQGTTYASTGLSSGTTYYYMVRAVGSAGKSAYSNPANATTTGPPPSMPSGGIPISPHFAGINAWMPDKVGSESYGGDLMAKWDEVEMSGVKIMRYGGSSVDRHADPSSAEARAQYVSLVQAMKASGFEPVLQVPVCMRCTPPYTALEAGGLVRYINETMGLGVKYWSIGNEPDLEDGNYSASGYDRASQVAAYLIPFATEMKKADPTIKILAPETAWYNDPIIKGLTTCDETADDSETDDLINLPGKNNSGHYYVDIISFHTYNGFDGDQTRDQVIGKLLKEGSFNDDLSALKGRIAECNRFNGRTGSDALKIAVTETNVNHAQPENDNIYGVGAASFLGGQFWAELMGISMQQGVDFVNFWSVIEGSGTRWQSEIGYFSGDGTKRPSYYHFQMMAENFRGNSITATNNQPPPKTIKTFGAQDVNHIAVMILNQDEHNGFDYTVRLNNGAVSGTDPLKVNVDAGVAVEYSDTISSQSTTLLIFDGFGVLKRKIEYGVGDSAPVVSD